ncbi:dephospho-CoA kinase [Opitutia bacterium ISCC 51]|nr:dephospho-CoA kinase [Opitutae bacterium ISCC 51]QXD26454.1 dephospho-CoA kinase [Opitutae bacterium ISCC 52]
MLVGLTGSFGSGKSSVLECFRELGASVVDSDVAVAEAYSKNELFRSELRNRFGNEIFDSEGKVDRKALGKRVFNNAEELQWLESALHPLVRKHRSQQMVEKPEALWIAEIPLLFEKNLEKEVERSISVVSSYSLRVSRLKNRGFSPEEVEARRQKQLPQTQKISRADFVILNDGSIEFLKRQVKRLFEQLHS